MVLLPHMLIGAVIGSKFDNLWIIFIFGIISHFLTDMLPHWDYVEDLKQELKTKFWRLIIKLSLDFFGGLALIYFAFQSSHSLIPILVGTAGAILPDFLVFIDYLCQVFLKTKSRVLGLSYAFHQKVHYPKKYENFKIDFASETIILALTLSLIIFWK